MGKECLVASAGGGGQQERTAVEAVDLGALGERLGYFLRRAQVAVFQDFHAHFEALDIRPAQYSVLALIETNPGLSPSRISQTLAIKKANLVPLIDGLESRGFVKRSPAAQDRRSQALKLTPAGKALLRKLHRIAERHESRIIDAVGVAAYARLFKDLSAIADIKTGSWREE